MKKAILISVLILCMIFLPSCTVRKKSPAGGSKGPGAGQTGAGKEQEIVNNQERQQAQILPPPKSFLNESSSIPSDKVYYTGKAVVLTYHHISGKPFSSITIKPERFESDVKMLKENYFSVITMRDMINCMLGKAKFPRNAVVISFDDGIGSFYKYAYPVLKKYNVPAVNFVITSRSESYSPSEDDFNPLGPDQIREMYMSGIVDIQSHSHNGHQYVVRNEEGKEGAYLCYRIYDKNSRTFESDQDYNERVENDLVRSINLIGKYTDNKPDILCFPYGSYNSNLIKLAKEAGFKYFVTTAYGNNREGSKSIIIKRIRSGDSKLTTQKLMQNIIDCGQDKPQPKH